MATEVAGKTWWDRIDDVLNTKELLTLLASTGTASSVALWVGRRLPAGWDAQDKLLAGLAAFTLAGLAALVLIRASIAVAPHAERWRRRTFSEAPRIKAVTFDGETAVIEITNEGGTAVFYARGQILSAEGGDKPGPRCIKRQDTFPMVWRSDFKPDAFIVVPGTKLRKGASAKLRVAGFFVGQGTVRSYSTLRIYGGDVKADEFPIDFGHAASPVVTLELTITAEPPLKEPFVRRYEMLVPARERIVMIRERQA